MKKGRMCRDFIHNRQIYDGVSLSRDSSGVIITVGGRIFPVKVKLFTKDGGFVGEGITPPLRTPPDIIIWGERFFICPDVDFSADHPDAVKDSEYAYVEAFAYALLM